MVQEMLKSQSRGDARRGRKRSSTQNPFAGIIKCGCCGTALTPTYTVKKGRKYVYYFCQQNSKNPEHQCSLKRIPAGDIESAVMAQLASLFRTPSILRETLSAVREREEGLRKSLLLDRELLAGKLEELKTASMNGDTDLTAIKDVGDRMAEVVKQLEILKNPSTENEIIAALGDAAGLWEFLIPAARYELLRLVIGKITVHPDKIQLVLQIAGLKQLAEEMAVSGYFTNPHEIGNDDEMPSIEQNVLPDGGIELTMPLTLKNIGGHRNVIIPKTSDLPPRQESIIRAIQNAKKWTQMLISGEAANLTVLAKQLGMKTPYVTRILSLANLAPDIIETICAGREPDGLSLERLVKGFSSDWHEQRMELGFA